jgi:hypothetical protein
MDTESQKSLVDRGQSFVVATHDDADELERVEVKHRCKASQAADWALGANGMELTFLIESLRAGSAVTKNGGLSGSGVP